MLSTAFAWSAARRLCRQITPAGAMKALVASSITRTPARNAVSLAHTGSNEAAVFALSAVDGRYLPMTAPLREWVSEAALIRERIAVEIEWLKALQSIPLLPKHTQAINWEALDQLVAEFDDVAALRVKAIESITRHDVKAVEYYIKEKMADEPSLAPLAELVHFACTSEDISNLAYARMLQGARGQVLLPQQAKLLSNLADLAAECSEMPLLSHTHGQPATPTTMGRELGVFLHRLQLAMARLQAVVIRGKLSGAVGNFAAHHVACPEVEWQPLAQGVVERMGLEYVPIATQIECHDWMAEYAFALVSLNTILLDASRDMWQYVSRGYFKQAVKPGEVGSSTMPHKVNPIYFENAEGNLGIANSLLQHLATKLPVSRMQRDLSDSTVLRSWGTALGHCAIAYAQFMEGVSRVQPNQEVMQAELEATPEVLAEAVQTVLRQYQVPNAYEILKEATRGKNATVEDILSPINSTDIPHEAKTRLAALQPSSYIGYSTKQAMTAVQSAKRFAKQFEP